MPPLPRASRAPARIVVGVMFAALAAVAVACGGDKPSVRPKDATYAGVMGAGAACRDDDTGEPLVVDWRPEERADLEVAMRNGVAVVQYDCRSLRLLGDCGLEGSYGFMGVTTKEQVVRFEDADEVRANLPLSGVKLGGELSQGSTLDVALVMIGKKMSTRREARSYELHGRCAGATHFVRGVTVGAFAMTSGSKGEAAVAAEMFGIGTTVGTRSAKSVMNKEGKLESCQAADPEKPTPPSQCAAPLRMQLLPIDKGAIGGDDDVAPTCPPGFVVTGGKCAKPSDAVAHLCHGDDVADCTKQCERRDAGSCVHLAEMYEKGKVVPQDAARAMALQDRACELGDVNACNTLGTFHWRKGDTGRALALFKPACDAGNTSACANMATMFKSGHGVPKDEAKAVSLYRLACDGGNPPACGMLGNMVADGRGTEKDPARALELFKRACQGSFPRGCADLGARYQSGNGVPKDTQKAYELLTRACDGGDAKGCMFLGEMVEKGEATSRDPVRAFSLYQKACDGEYLQACLFVGAMYDKGEGVSKDVAKALPNYMLACEDGNDVACDMLAGIYILAKGTPRDLGKAARALSFGCGRGDKKNCGHLVDVARAFLAGDGVPKDVPKGAGLLQIACGSGDMEACGSLAYWNEFGRGIRRDLREATKGYDRACRAGNANACSNFAVMISNGKGTTRDAPKAQELFEKACGAGDVWACLNVATYAAYGIDRKKDAKLAESTVTKVCGGKTQDACVKSLRSDCAGGEERTCTVLGALVSEGVGFPKDKKAGHDLFGEGCAKGDELGCAIAKKLGVKPPPPIVAGAPSGPAFPIPDGPLPLPERTPLVKTTAALGLETKAIAPPPPPPPSYASPPSRAPTPTTTEAPPPPSRSSEDHLVRRRSSVRVELGAAKWQAKEPLVATETTGGLLAIRHFEVDGSGRIGFMTAYDLVAGYTDQGQVPHDFSGTLGVGIYLGPLLLAPGLGIGLDGLNGGSEDAVRVASAFYWKLEGRLLIDAGPIGLEGIASRIRRGSVTGDAGEQPNETRLTGRVYTPFLGNLSLGVEASEFDFVKGLSGLVGFNL